MSGQRSTARRQDQNIRAAETIDDDDENDLVPAASYPVERRGPNRTAIWLWAALLPVLGIGYGELTGAFTPGLVVGVILIIVGTVIIRYGCRWVYRNGPRHGRRLRRGARTGWESWLDGWRVPPGSGPEPQYPAEVPPARLIPVPPGAPWARTVPDPQPVDDGGPPSPGHRAAAPPADGGAGRHRHPGGRRHARPPAARSASAPSWWRQACGKLADLTPDGITETEQGMMAERSGLAAYGMALDGWADLLVSETGYDEEAVAKLRELSGDITGNAAKFEAAWRALALFYEDHIRFADDGHHAPHDGRHFEN